MRESVIAGLAGLVVVSATAALATALVTWKPSVVAPATAAAMSAGLEAATVVAVSIDIPEPDLPAGLANLEVAAVASEPAATALPDAAGASFAMLLPAAGSSAFAEPVISPRAADPAVREMVRRNLTPAAISVLPPPRPAFTEVRRASASLTDLQPSTAAVPTWSDLPSVPTSSWSGLFATFGESEPRSTRPEKTLQSGMASWYGPGFHGRRTASGEVFNQNALTAAHRHLPFGSKVRVVDQTTGRSIVVRINDRGPFSHGRVIDLSKASAQALGMSGTARVKIVSAE